MKIRAGGGRFRAAGGSFRAAGCSPLLFLFMGNTSPDPCPPSGSAQGMHLKEGTCLKCSFQRVVIIGLYNSWYACLPLIRHVRRFSGSKLFANVQTLIAGRKSRERESERETARCLHTNLFLRISKRNVWVSQSILLQLLPMRTQNPNLSCASAFVRQTVLTLRTLYRIAYIFKLTKHSILNTIRV